jgi:FkbM family methyltransferase
VLSQFKVWAKQSAKLFGLDVRKRDSLDSEHCRLALQLTAYHVDLVLDIGANTGQWAQSLRQAGYAGDMISFEPLSAAHDQLTRNAKRDQRWKIAPRVALGEQNSEIEMNVAANSFSSSILPMLPMHLEGAPQSAYVASERAPMRTLDSLIGSVVPDVATRVFCKLDVQGYEARVLAGAEKLLKRIVGLQMEMSLAPLYEGQPTFRELLDAMARSEFDIHGFVPGFVDPKSGRMLQIDGVFFKRAGCG